MDKNWILCEDRLSDEYVSGVESFIKLAKHHLNKDNETRCPCQHCLNEAFQDIKVVERHLWVKGFSQLYQNWIFHGEPLTTRGIDNAEEVRVNVPKDDDEKQNDDMMPALQVTAGEMHIEDTTDEDYTEDQDSEDRDSTEESNKLLYPGCSLYSILRFVYKLIFVKAQYNWCDKSFDTLLHMLKEVFPEGTKLPNTHSQAKLLTDTFGLSYESFQMYIYDNLDDPLVQRAFTAGKRKRANVPYNHHRETRSCPAIREGQQSQPEPEPEPEPEPQPRPQPQPEDSNSESSSASVGLVSTPEPEVYMELECLKEQLNLYKKYDEVDQKIKKLQEVIYQQGAIIAKCYERLGIEANGHTSIGPTQHPPSSPPLPPPATTAS